MIRRNIAANEYAGHSQAQLGPLVLCQPADKLRRRIWPRTVPPVQFSMLDAG
jgi:hypothetical protein